VYVGLGPVVARARVLVYEVLDRGAQAAVFDGARCALQIRDRGAQANAPGAAQVLDRGAQAAVFDGARCALQIRDRGAQADAPGAAQVLDRGAQAVARGGTRFASQGCVYLSFSLAVANRRGKYADDFRVPALVSLQP
jgi:hypothetical protein